ncbi:MFS transporter [Halomonas cupida]|uniref:MFS transporter n=1 Tax=Halomonas cupida TaxID=44933 RepID=A0A1M7GAH0_9GAMM|nr:oligopeptide:H+ symporter [Halomonas cupida]GEN23727.1 MFS transporter [Halomonas cupida]SHM13382.1 proton-dependent oligopeptide transporter, POT family [Halomonas cupida]
MTTENVSRSAPEKQFFGHPRSLATLFGMEVWERFSFYGMQAILLIYLYYEVSRGGLGISQPVAIGIVGAYGSGVYLASILGGWFADRIFGAERTLFYSGLVVMVGHIALAVLPGVHGVTAGLICVALGSGGVKATCSSLVGSLYEPGSDRRDAGFSIFYLGINVGGFVGPLLTGLLQQNAGFHYGFGIAAIGMALGLAQYAFGRKKLPASQKTAPNPLEAGRLKYYGLAVIALVGALLGAVALGWVRADNLSDVLLVVIAIAAVAYFAIILSSPRINTEERRRVLAFIPLFLTSGAYWALYSQSYTVITAFFDQRVDRNVFGWEVPVGWLVSAQALTVIVLSGVFAWLWTILGKRQPSSASKFVIAMFVIGLTFLGYLPYLGAEGAAMPLFMLVLLLLGFTASELCLSPIGLSVTTRLAPAAFQTQMMALFFMSLALGFAAGGSLGAFYTEANEVNYFIAMAGLGIVTAVLLMLCLPFIKRASRGTE